MSLCPRALHEMTDANLLIIYEKSGREQIKKKCRACTYEYNKFYKRFKRMFPDQPIPELWFLFQFPKYKYCKSGKHLMTPRNIQVVGSRGDKRCKQCYSKYWKKYQKKYRKEWGLDRVYKVFEV